MTMSYDIVELAPVVTTTKGAVQGRWQSACSAAYLSIPFAKPPVGERRFAAPEPMDAWEGVLRATEYGATPQRRPFSVTTTIPEPSIPGDSTLNVNVFTPAPGDRAAKLPVFVWIHGGGFFAGSPASPWYNGRAFNADGIVTVTVSYRLGFQGFGWVEGAPLNRGMLDQVAALEWVRDNIAEFGGDPAKVTIGGQSAGGGSVLALLASPMAQGLFRGVISESGCFNGVTVEQAEKVGRALAEQVGIEPTLEAWSKVDENVILDHERDVNAIDEVPAGFSCVDDLVAAIKQGYVGLSNLAFAPTVDGAFLTAAPPVAWAAGTGKDVSLLIGTQRDDFTGPMPGACTFEQNVEQLRAAGLSDEAVAQYVDEMHRVGEENATGHLATLCMFRLGLAEAALVRVASGAGERTWLYDFAQWCPVSHGTHHCEEIPYAFNLLDAPNAQNVLGAGASQPLANAVHGTWCEFISTGKLVDPSAAQDRAGAIEFLGSKHYKPAAYQLERELIDLAR